MAKKSAERLFDNTPTWAVAGVCAVIIILSIALEKILHRVGSMGSNMKKSIFDEHTSKALQKWHMAAKKKHGRTGRSPIRTPGGGSPTASMGGSTLPSTGTTLHRFKTTGHSTSSFTNNDLEKSDYEADTSNLIIKVDHDDSDTEIIVPHTEEETRKKEEDFSFVKPAPPK
ncbi:MLO-like protein 10 [Cornus florida]|uniref:MLO-like protein 10 n=1 Tax=Cornus florida TaxID=4283 RepID=UPI00289CB5C0|nr:MLO-like protein 10 [Cornus florida]